MVCLRWCPYFFWFYLFLEARAENLTDISLVFSVDLKTPKGYFEINWPLPKLPFTYRSAISYILTHIWINTHAPHCFELSFEVVPFCYHTQVKLLPSPSASHCYFTRLNLKKMGSLQFCLPALLEIHRNHKQKELSKSCEGFLR